MKQAKKTSVIPQINESKSKVVSNKSKVTNAALVCAATVFLTFSYTNQMVAQTLIKNAYSTANAGAKHYSLKAESSSSNESTSTTNPLYTLLDNLKGTDASYANRQKVVTTGRPYADSLDAKKVFLLYNVGTHKFLNLGGYWGTHAALSSVPRFFWLQRRNEKKVDTWAYARYPEADGTKQTIASSYINPLKNFISKTTYQVGTKEGGTRTNATYEYVKYHKGKTSENVVEDGFDCKGASFVKKYEGNLNDYDLNAEIDLSNCALHNNQWNTPCMENILSIGTDISKYSDASGANIHISYHKTDNYLRIDFANGSNHNNTINDKDGWIKIWLAANAPNIGVKLTKDALTITGTNISNVYKVADYPALQKLIDSSVSEIQVGSTPSATDTEYVNTERNANSCAKYNTLTFKSTKEVGDEDKSLYDANTDKASEGFVNTITGVHLENENEYIEASIDLSTCKTAKENVFSIGQDISTWGSSLAADEGNIHFYYLGKDDKNYKLYVAYVNKDHSDDLKRVVYVPVGEKMNIKLSNQYLQVNGKTIYTDVDPMPEIPDAPAGYEGEIIRFRYADADNKIYEIGEDGKYVIVNPSEADYDDAHGINTTYNGYIYTKESRTDEKINYFISSNFVLEQSTSINDNEGNFLGWTPKINDEFGSIGVFGDRNLPQKKLWDDPHTKDLAINTCQWNFVPVSTTDHTYRIYLDMSDIEIPKRLASATADNKYYEWEENLSGNFYLEAKTQNVYGDELQNYDGTRDEVTATEYSDYDGAEAIHYTDGNTPTDDKSVWKLISLEEYLTLFNKSYRELQQAGASNGTQIDMTYKLHDPDFKRRNSDLIQWQMDGNLADYVRVGLDGYAKHVKDGKFTDEYLAENGGTSLLGPDAQANRSRYMGVEIRETGLTGDTGNAKGKFYQSFTVNNPGYYTIKCNIFSTHSSKLFVNYDGEDKEFSSGTYKTSVNRIKYIKALSQLSTWPFTGAYPMYNLLVAMEDENLYNEKLYNLLGKDAFGDMIMHKDEDNQSITFYVTSEMLAKHGGSMEVKYGIEIDHSNFENVEAKPYMPFAAKSATSSETSNEGTSSNADSDYDWAWTVFDNFQLLYGGSAGNVPLILDEDNTDLDYLDKTKHSYRSFQTETSSQNTQLHLHRTFTANQWNSIMLPVGLTKDQFTQAFGEDAKLAKLSALTAHEIQFKTISSPETYDAKDTDNNLYDATEYWLKPMTPYIIKITDADRAKGNDTNANGYSAELFYWSDLVGTGDDAKESCIVQIPKDTRCFTIDNINLMPGVVKTKEHSDNVSADERNELAYRWDFADMTANVNTIENGKNVKKDCPYVMKSEGISQMDDETQTDGSMVAYGSLAKNYETANGKNALLSGRPSLVDSYILIGGKLPYIPMGAGLKGFRCWFEYTAPSSTTPSSEAKLMLDGVSMTTGIDNILANDADLVIIDQYKRGIYNLAGQLLSQDPAKIDQMPRGIYIVNGKKVIKE